MIEAVSNADIVIGSRFIGSKKPRSMRMFGSNLISWAIRLTTGRFIKDPTSGLRAFNSRVIAYMANGLNCGPEPDTVSYLIKRANARVIEIPVKMADRYAGESYLNPWRSVVYMARMTVSIFFIQLFRKRLGGELK